jgi:hypothetical protein
MLALVAAACSGTTEARTNSDLEPGSGELGSGDAPGPTDAPPDELGEEPAPPTGTAVGLPCGADAAREEIATLPERLFLGERPHDQRLEALQLGSDPDVAAWFAATRAAADDDERVTAARVDGVVCVDDGSANLRVALRTAAGTRFERGSAMLVDGSWQITLRAFCDWDPVPSCAEAGLTERADAALSPALRGADG